MFYLMGFFRTSSLGDTISTNSERTALRRWGEESGYIDLCNKGQVVWISKYSYEVKKIRYLTLRNLAKQRGNKEPVDESERGQWKSWLKTQHSKNEDHGIQSHNFMAHRWGKSGNSDRFYFGDSKITADGDYSQEIKRRLFLGRKAMTNLDSIFKNRGITLPKKVHIVKTMVFPVVIYGCESWTLKKAESPKSWCFWTVVPEKTLESPLDCKEIKPMNPKGNQSWIFIGRADDEAQAPILWLLYAKNQFIGKDLDAGKDWGHEKRATEVKLIKWHQLNGHEFEQAGMLHLMESQRVTYALVTEQQQQMYGKIQEFRFTEILPFICISAIWGQYHAFFLSTHFREQLQSDGCWIPGIVFPGCSWGSEIHIWRTKSADDCDILHVIQIHWRILNQKLLFWLMMLRLMICHM